MKQIGAQLPIRTKKILLSLAGLVLLYLLGKFLLGSFNHEERVKIASVQVTPVKIQAIPVVLEAPATIEAVESVAIRAQVSGIMKKVHIVDGQMVQAGQLLFEIDPSPFIAALQQTNAILQRDKAQYLQAQADAKRYEELVKLEYVTQQQYQQAKTAAQAQAAVVASDEAQVKQAKINLDYTQIHTPLSGKAGSISVHQGDLVSLGATEPLVLVNQLDEVLVKFHLGQNQLAAILANHSKNPLTVNILSEDRQHILGRGKLVFIDNNVDGQTGTLLLKGQLPNKDNAFWPGSMVTAQLVISIEPHARVVPVNALQLDQQGNFVYLVEQGKAKIRYVKVARHANDWAVIASGLQGHEKVIVTIPPDLTEGTSIHAIPMSPMSHPSGAMPLVKE